MRVLPIAKDGVRLAVGNRSMMLLRVIALSTVALSGQSPVFTNAEKSHIRTFWNEAGRFDVQAPEERANKGPWQVRLSPEGSYWLYNYNSLRRSSKVHKKPGPAASSLTEWDNWVREKIASDRFRAGAAAAEADSRYLGRPAANSMPVASDPGAEPSELVAYAGLAPEFASAVVPNLYYVNFPDGTKVRLPDNPSMPSNYAQYRFPQGVMSVGTPVKSLPEDEVNSLFAEAGINGSEQKVMKAVSMLEGGFDSVNTYDTGFVSVGLIQFACLSGGSGSLGQVMLREKHENPQAFTQDFHRFGLDVTDEGSLVALDINTGQVYQGTDAAHAIIDDKRLVAVFQHAGQNSKPFRIAQLEVARDQYYPSNDVVTINLNGQTVEAKVCDLVHSEAGMATLMDRKVNTGKIDPFASVLSQVGTQYGCHTIDDLAAHEKDVILACKYRRDYTLDPTLSQPGGIAARDNALTSRHGTRGMRKKP